MGDSTEEEQLFSAHRPVPSAPPKNNSVKRLSTMFQQPIPQSAPRAEANRNGDSPLVALEEAEPQHDASNARPSRTQVSPVSSSSSIASPTTNTSTPTQNNPNYVNPLRTNPAPLVLNPQNTNSSSSNPASVSYVSQNTLRQQQQQQQQQPRPILKRTESNNTSPSAAVPLSPTQRVKQCTLCGIPLMFTVNTMSDKTVVRCYNCSHTNTFPNTPVQGTNTFSPSAFSSSSHTTTATTATTATATTATPTLAHSGSNSNNNINNNNTGTLRRNNSNTSLSSANNDDSNSLRSSGDSDVSGGSGVELEDEEYQDVLLNNTTANSRPGPKNQFNKKMMGAFKTMREKAAQTSEAVKTKAIETKTKVATSNFVSEAKEKAAIAAQTAKEKASSAASAAASTTKAAAHKAQKALNRSGKDENGEGATSGTPGPNPLATSSGSLGSSSAAASASPPFIPAHRVFGVPLAEAVAKSSTLVPDVPDIVAKCVSYLHNKGVQEEGIFRLSGSQQTIKELKIAFDRGENVDLTIQKDEAVVSGLLKLWFRELPESIFVASQLGKLQAISNIADPMQRVIPIRDFVSTLPACNYAVLHSLIDLLHAVSLYKDKNRMSVSNLGIVFSATLSVPIEVIEPMIEHHTQVFVRHSTDSAGATEQQQQPQENNPFFE